MTTITQERYLNTLKTIASKGDSIVSEAANKVLSDLKDNLSLKEFKEELKDLTYLMEGADKQEKKEIEKIYSVALKLCSTLK